MQSLYRKISSRLLPVSSPSRRLSAIADLVDLRRYNLETPAGVSSVADQARKSLDETGVAHLPGFLKSHAVSMAASEINERVRDHPVFFTHTMHNLYLDDVNSGKEAPAGRDLALHSSFHRTDVGSVAWDELSDDSPLRILYNWSGVVVRFLRGRVVRERSVGIDVCAQRPHAFHSHEHE